MDGRFERITHNPNIMAGKPTIRGMRITVSMIVRQLAEGETAESLLARYPHLEPEDIREALAYAAWRLEERDVNVA